MDYDLEVYAAHLKIRDWYLYQIKQYRKELPRPEFQATKVKLDAILKRANLHHRENELTPLIKMHEELLFFVVPWEVLVWFSQRPKS